jgi:hypothetical protein
MLVCIYGSMERFQDGHGISKMMLCNKTSENPFPFLPKTIFLRENFGLVIWRGIITKEKQRCMEMLPVRCDAVDFIVRVDPEKDDSSAEDGRLSLIIERDEW